MKDIKNLCSTPFKEQASRYLGIPKLMEADGDKTPAPLTNEQLDAEMRAAIERYNMTEYAQPLYDTDHWCVEDNDEHVALVRDIRSKGGSRCFSVSYYWNRQHPGRKMQAYLYPGKNMPYWYDRNKSAVVEVDSMYDDSRWTGDNNIEQYRTRWHLDTYSYWMTTFPTIKETHKKIVEEIVPAYPFLGDVNTTEPTGTIFGSIYIKDMGVRVVKNKVMIRVFSAKVGSAAYMFKELSDRNAALFYTSDGNYVCEIPIERFDSYMKRIKPFLNAVIEAQGENKKYEKFDCEKENYRIESDADRGLTEIAIKKCYSKEALKRLCSEADSREETQDEYLYRYKWTSKSTAEFADEITDIVKFLDNPHNVIARDIPEYKELWGVTWGKGLSDEQAKKVHYYYVVIRNRWGDSWDVDTNDGSSSPSARNSDSTIFINPFWFLKQSKTTQLSLLKRAFRDLEVNKNPYSLYNLIISQCKSCIKEAISDRVVRHYEKLLKRKMDESTVDSKRNKVLFYIIKREDGKYYSDPAWSEDANADAWIDDINQAEAYENYDDAEDVLAELIYNDVDDSNKDSNPEEYLDAVDAMQDRFTIKGVKAESFYEKRSAIKRMKDAIAFEEASKKFIIRDDDGFYNEEEDTFVPDIKDATRYNSLKDARNAARFFFEDRAELLGFGRKWVVDAMNEISIEPISSAKKIAESKEKDLIVDFAIPVSDKGRIKANDAKKLLKYLAANKLLRLGRTYFITDNTGWTTCWDLEEGLFNGYSFNCEVTETPDGEECDIYHELTFDKENGKLTNFEWECHRV